MIRCVEGGFHHTVKLVLPVRDQFLWIVDVCLFEETEQNNFLIITCFCLLENEKLPSLTSLSKNKKVQGMIRKHSVFFSVGNRVLRSVLSSSIRVSSVD